MLKPTRTRPKPRPGVPMISWDRFRVCIGERPTLGLDSRNIRQTLRQTDVTSDSALKIDRASIEAMVNESGMG
ncbi:MAG: hypothetical protein DHS20C16_15880 [Phycisphaerae bacterium]|nr:MAG: hypothetical protein DHS20C16_15880 [Phycisphaerae bacterium]